MILSYHPLIEADRNLNCAGREPDETDAAAMAAADAVVLNQGCYESLYRMAKENCLRVFPDYDARFDFPGKTGQIRLFRQHQAPHPDTEIYESVDAYQSRGPGDPAFPQVFKFDWGGEGETVFWVKTAGDLHACLDRARAFEKTGQRGFLVQDFLPHEGRTLRVVVIHRFVTAYWRIQDDASRFGTALSSGARIDQTAAPHRQSEAMALVQGFCRKTGINLAGFDLLVPEPPAPPRPLFIEVNYYFGRQGLGGSQAYYRLLERQVRNWMQQA